VTFSTSASDLRVSHFTKGTEFYKALRAPWSVTQNSWSRSRETRSLHFAILTPIGSVSGTFH
jgi:hypothetical protein